MERGDSSEDGSYIVFDASGDSVSFALVKAHDYALWNLLLAAVILVVLLVILIVCKTKKKRKARKAAASASPEKKTPKNEAKGK